jgi:N-acetylmuramoyl-L-alanine amidase
MLRPTGGGFTGEIAKHAEKILLCALCALCGSFGIVTVAAAPPVKSMYADATVREVRVRAAMAAPDAPPAVLGEVHAIVTAYESIVRHYPGTGYGDDALWLAGRLSLDAFARFGQTADREAGVKLLKKLIATFPTSRLAKLVPEQLAKISQDEPPARPEGRPLQPAPTVPGAPAPNGGAPPIASPGGVGLPPSHDASADHRSLATTGQAGRGLAPNAAGGASSGPTSSRLTNIKAIRRVVLPDAVRVTIELDGEVPFHEERIQDPARVFVDLPGTRPAPALVDQTLRFEGDADIVRQIRVGRHPNNTTRVVLDAASVTSYSVYPLYSPFRLVIDCVRVPAAVAAATMTDKILARVPPAATPQARQSNESAAAALARPATPLPRQNGETATAPPLTARTMTNPWLRRFPGRKPTATTLLALAHQGADPPTTAALAPEKLMPAALTPLEKIVEIAPTVPPPPAAALRRGVEAAATAAPVPNARGGLSIARQLGLGVSRIVIDPGHGGHDPGAKGKGITEAELVLDVALRLEKLLEKVDGVEVILTRKTDEFVPLPERTAIANREGADLFLSIHANASTNGQAHGIETYFLNFANNQSAAAVAARENAASTQAMGGLPDFVKAIALNNKLDESRDFALHVQRAMVERQRTVNRVVRDLGVKQAPFVVLIGANMPSVLAETGFVTNPQEAKLLKGSVYRQKLAESLFNAIRKYQSSLKNVPTLTFQ